MKRSLNALSVHTLVQNTQNNRFNQNLIDKEKEKEKNAMMNLDSKAKNKDLSEETKTMINDGLS